MSLEAVAQQSLISVALYYVQEFLEDGYNGWQVERTATAFANQIQYAFDHRDRVPRMGQNAIKSVRHYAPYTFDENWKAFYDGIENDSKSFSRKSQKINRSQKKGYKVTS